MHLDRLIMTLETVAVADRPISAIELQQTTGLPRPTCYCLLPTLAEQTLLDKPDEAAAISSGSGWSRLRCLAKPMFARLLHQP